MLTPEQKEDIEFKQWVDSGGIQESLSEIYGKIRINQEAFGEQRVFASPSVGDEKTHIVVIHPDSIEEI